MSCRRALGGWLALLLAMIVLSPIAADEARANSKYAALVIDAHTGAVLKASNTDALRYPASLTKIMTIYVTFEEIAAGRLSPTSKITFSEHAAGQPPSKLGLKAGETITVDAAIRALVTKSANDVAAAVAERISGSEAAFARRMTETAHRLGMSKTTFRNASGLPNDAQRTTARDMVTLARRIITDFPEQYKVFSLRSFSHGGHTYRNHNGLLGRYDGTDGIKTGYIRASGFNLVASVKRGDKHLIAAVFGGKTARRRDAHMKALLDAAWPKATARRGPLVAGVGLGGVLTRAPRPRVKPPLAAAASPTSESTEKTRPGVVQLAWIAVPPRNRELPLAAPISRIAAATAAAPPPPPAPLAPLRVASMARPRLPAGAEAYAAGADELSPADAIERLIRAAMAPAAAAPSQPPTERQAAASRLILPPVVATAAADAPAPVEVAAATPDPEPVEYPTGWQIQVGAYANNADARDRLSEVQGVASSLLADATAFTQPVDKGSETLYRARFAGLDKSEAKRACKTLKKRKIACIVLAE